MKAIKTKFHGPTESNPSRYSASDADGNRIFYIPPADCQKSYEENHLQACRILRNKMAWTGRMYGGSFGADYVWVFPDDRFMVGE